MRSDTPFRGLGHSGGGIGHSACRTLRLSTRSAPVGMVVGGLARPLLEGVPGQVQWRLQVTHKAVGGSYWPLEGRLRVVGAKGRHEARGCVPVGSPPPPHPPPLKTKAWEWHKLQFPRFAIVVVFPMGFSPPPPPFGSALTSCIMSRTVHRRLCASAAAARCGTCSDCHCLRVSADTPLTALRGARHAPRSGPWNDMVCVCVRGGYNSDDITKVRVGGGGGLLSQEAVMTE